MFCTFFERNGCIHSQADGCLSWSCEWSSFDAISEARWEAGEHKDNRGVRIDGFPTVFGQAIVTDVNLKYLATITSAEAALMADNALVNFVDGGEWYDARNDLWCEACRGEWKSCRWCYGSKLAAEDFVERRLLSQTGLTEGLIFTWGNDIAGELRLYRGWCPHLPFDKRPATEEIHWQANVAAVCSRLRKATGIS